MMRFLTFVGWVCLLPTLTAVGGEIRVVYWFDRAKPLDTFRFQVYDLRKNEFTPEVERWLSATTEKFPGYQVYTRDVDLSHEQGETDKLKIGSAITREFLVVGMENGYSFGAYTGTSAIPAPRLRPLPRVGGPWSNPIASPAWSPFPIPYPRPHP